MPKFKNKIRLIASSIEFNFNSIIYNVEPETEIEGEHTFVCPSDIVDKELILKPTIYNRDNKRVVYTTSNVTPHFYQSIIEGKISNLSEYKFELNKIYAVGEVVGIILL